MAAQEGLLKVKSLHSKLVRLCAMELLQLYKSYERKSAKGLTLALSKDMMHLLEYCPPYKTPHFNQNDCRFNLKEVPDMFLFSNCIIANITSYTDLDEITLKIRIKENQESLLPPYYLIRLMSFDYLSSWWITK